MLCSQIYLTVHRKIEGNEQKYEENKEVIRIYDDRITTASEHFQLRDILDISFRNISDAKGFLYLHTTRGLYSYVTDNEPQQLMRIFKELKKQN
ncbi:hypothetical protein AABM38_13005 [Heyndrickxia sp. MSNUG]|uniref:hypothetical protein n=1 Tax=Heyndrickxia sp. MSNUG TaxID=3136677 RepID=UPI003C2E0651